MGAYYNAVINNEERYSTWSVDEGAKLMEHAYMGNTYTEGVMSLLLDNPAQVEWVCDYTEPHLDGDHTWGNTWNNTVKTKLVNTSDIPVTYTILNHTKKSKVDMKKLLKAYNNLNDSEYRIHPIPILCNSESYSMGGGDFHEEDSRRGIWANDKIEIKFGKDSSGYEDVTEDCVFIEDMEYNDLFIPKED